MKMAVAGKGLGMRVWWQRREGGLCEMPGGTTANAALEGLPWSWSYVGVLTVGLPRDASGRRLFGTDRRIWNLKVNARNTRHRFRQVRVDGVA
jgi:hypothetical protein